MITVEKKVRFGKRIQAKETRKTATKGRIARVARLMALAIRFDQMIRDGVVADQAELARLGHVTRARLTQIMNLLCLAPEIQEALLLVRNTEKRREVVTERSLRLIASVTDWGEQRRIWQGQKLFQPRRSADIRSDRLE
jgi:hypothetical protein